MNTCKIQMRSRCYWCMAQQSDRKDQMDGIYFLIIPLCWIIKMHIDLAGWILEKKKRIVCKLCIVNNNDTFECKKKVFLLQNLKSLRNLRPDSIYQHYQRYLEEQFTVNYQIFSTIIQMICYRRFLYYEFAGFSDTFGKIPYE